MTPTSLVLVLIGAIVGAVVTAWYNATMIRLRTRIRVELTKRRSRTSGAHSMSIKLVEYYVAHGLGASLYSSDLAGPIALLFDPDFRFPTAIGITADDLFDCDHQFTRFPVDKRILRWYRHRGARLFDGEFLWLKSVALNNKALLTLTVGRFNFFAYATLCRRLQREISSPWRHPRLHDKYMTTFQAALASPLRPQAIGCMAATLFEGESGLCVAIAKRSSDVVNAPASRSVLPVFGMECNAIGLRASRYGLTFYNFVREFCEELFDYEELIQMLQARRVDPDWIFQLPPAALILREATSGRLHLMRTGFGINPSDGILNCAIVAHFTSRKFFRQVKDECKLNWESAKGASTSPSVEFIPLTDKRLDELASSGEMDPSSIFALDLARRYGRDLAGRRRKPRVS